MTTLHQTPLQLLLDAAVKMDSVTADITIEDGGTEHGGERDNETNVSYVNDLTFGDEDIALGNEASQCQYDPTENEQSSYTISDARGDIYLTHDNCPTERRDDYTRDDGGLDADITESDGESDVCEEASPILSPRVSQCPQHQGS